MGTPLPNPSGNTGVMVCYTACVKKEICYGNSRVHIFLKICSKFLFKLPQSNNTFFLKLFGINLFGIFESFHRIQRAV